MEKPIENVPVDPEDTKVASSEDIVTCTPQEQKQTGDPKETMGDKTNDAAESEKVTLEMQNVAKIIPLENNEEDSLNQVDGSQIEDEEHQVKEIEKPSTTEVLMEDADDVDVVNIGNEIKTELLDSEENKESTSLQKGEVEKPIENVPVDPGDIKVASSEDKVTTCTPQEENQTASPKETMGDKTNDAAESEEVTLEMQILTTSSLPENVAKTIPHENNEEDSLNQVDGSQIEDEEHLEKEVEKPSAAEVLMEDADDVDVVNIRNEIKTELLDSEENKESTSLQKGEMEKPIENVPVDPGDIKVASSEDIVTCNPQEQKQTGGPKETMGDTTNDAAESEELTLEMQYLAKTILRENNEEDSLNQVEGSQIEDEEHLEKGIEKPSAADVLMEDADDVDVVNIGNEIKTELLNSKENKESKSLQKEGEMEKPIENVPVDPEDIKIASSEDIVTTCTPQAQNQTGGPKEIMGDKTNDASESEEVTLEMPNVAKTIPHENNEDSLNQVDGSQDEEHLEKEIEKPSAAEVLMEDADDVNEVNIGNEIKTELLDSEENKESTLLLKEGEMEKPIGNVPVDCEDIKVASSEDIETIGTPQEQNQTGSPKETMGGKTYDAAKSEEATLEIQNVAKTIPRENNEEESPNQVDCSEVEHLEKESENLSSTEASVGDAHDEKDEPETRKAELTETKEIENQEDTKGTLDKEDTLVEKSVDSLQVDAEIIKESASVQETQTIPTEGQIPTANPQVTFSSKTEENTADAADTKEETSDLQSVAIPDGNNEDNSSNQKDGSQVRHEGHLENEDEKPCVIEASTGDTNDDESIIMYKAKSVDGDLQKADVSKNEKNTGSTLVKDTSFESLQAHADIKTSASGQDGETSYVREQRPTEKLQGITNEHKEEEINDATHASQDTPEEKIVAINASNEHLEKDSLIEVDGSPIKSETLTESESEKLENIADDESTIFNEVSTIGESLYVKERDISTETGDDKKDVGSQENEEHTETSSRATEDPSKETENDPNEFIGHVKEEKIDEGLEKTIMAYDIEVKKTDAEHHLVAHSEATDEEIIIPRVETNQESDGCRDNTTETINEDYEARSNCTVLSAEEAEVKVSNEDEEKEMEPNTEVPKEMVNSEDISTKTIESDEEERDLKNMQMTTPVDIAASQETGSDSVAVKDPHTKVSNASQDTEVKTSEGTNCKQEEPSFTELSEEDIRISNEKVTNDRSLESGATELTDDPKLVVEDNKCDDKKDVEKMGVLDDGSVITTQNENLVEAIKKESPEVQFPDAEKEAELMQHDPEVESPQKEIEVEQPIKVSPDVSESNVDGEAEERNSDNCKEISTISNSLEVEEISSPNAFQEPRSETLQEAGDTEAEKQHEDLPVLAQISDSSTERTEKDVQLCVASSGGSGITQEMQKLEEMSSPAQDENLVGKGDSNCNKLNNTSEDKNVEQEETTKGFLFDGEPPESEQAVILDEKVEEEYFKETSKVENPVSEMKRVINTEELQIGKAISGEEGEEGNEQKISDFSSAAPKMTEARNQDPKGSLSEAPPENSSCQVAAETNSFETADTRECTVVNDKPRLEDNLLYSSTGAQDTELERDAPETVETIRNAVESQEVEKRAVAEHAFISDVIEKEKNMELGQELPSKEEENMNFEVDEIIKSNTESREILKPEEQEKVVESIAQVQTCDVITDASKLVTEKENPEAAKEIKSDKFVADERFESKQTTYEAKETMEVNILSEKVDKGDEAAKNYHLSSCEEEVITGSHLEDKVKQEGKINKEELPDATKNKKVSRVHEDADDKAVEEPEDSWLASVSTERSFEKEQVISVEDITTVLDPHACTKTGTEGSREEVNSSNVASIEDESKRTEAGDLDIKLKRDDGLPDESTNTSVIAVIAGELPEKKDEDVICEDAPAKTVHTTIQDCGTKEENENTIMTQHQEMDIKSKYESRPIPEFQQEKEFEKQEEEPEVRSDSAAVAEATRVDNQKEEEATDECKGMAKPLTLEESTKISTPDLMQEYEIKDQEVKDTLTELRDLPRETLVKDSGVDDAQKDDPLDLQSIKKISEDVQELKDGSFEVSNEENQVEADQYGNKEAKFSSCAQEAEATQGCPVSETIKQEIEEQKPGATSETNSELKTTSYDVEQKIDDDYNDGWRDNSRIVTKEMVLDSDTHQASVEKSSTLSAKPQESQNQIDPVPALPDIEIGEKDQTPLPALDKNATPDEDRSEYLNPTSSIDNKHGESAEFSRDKGEILKPFEFEQGKAKCGREETAAADTTKDMDKSSLSDLLQVSIKDTLKVADHFASVKGPTIQKEELQVEKTETEHDCTKADDGKYDQEESFEQRKPDSGYEAPVLVDAGDADAKVVHKKSHNILSGVGSKVKHSISKVKKAITGKSSHPKPPSPK